MKILVIGGSYFYGRVFVMQACEHHDIMVVNRGTYSMKDFGVRELHGDRRDKALWEQAAEGFTAASVDGSPFCPDVVVDFCAYEAGDVNTVLEHLPCAATSAKADTPLAEGIKQYILISTVDVYQRTSASETDTTPGCCGLPGKDGFLEECELLREDAALEHRRIAGEAGAYIAGKVALEQELIEACQKRGIAYTILRPAILYGPYNYAPREQVFIQHMLQERVLPRITDAEGRFQFVYVKDAAVAIVKCLLNETAYGKAYNLCGNEIADYDMFYDALFSAKDVEVKEQPMTVAAAMAQGTLLPFPLTAAETLLCSNERSRRELGISYTDLKTGMAKTYRAFKGVFS
ncbi:MAG: NAD-dependent epimerase/dehydratase family protein [Lachnospiraceae bacterium]|nr:NAD-dependent epimerase/dehydratase family protein [Lachnospiraceae bacterium]